MQVQSRQEKSLYRFIFGITVMEKLKEAYLKVNTNAEIELQTSDSTAGMTGARKVLATSVWLQEN